MSDRDPLTDKITGCAMAVHRELGPGLPEARYEAALCIELADASLRFHRQVAFPVLDKGRNIGEYRMDLIVEDTVIVKLKSVERFDSIFEAQRLTYRRVTGKRVGLLINFNSRLLQDGIKRYVV